MCIDVQKRHTLSNPDNLGDLRHDSARSLLVLCESIADKPFACRHETSSTDSSVIWRHGCRTYLLRFCCSSKQLTMENVAKCLCRCLCAHVSDYLTKANHGSTMILKLTCTSMAVKVDNFPQLSVTVKSLLRNWNRIRRTWKMTPSKCFRINSIFNRMSVKNYEKRKSAF